MLWAIVAEGCLVWFVQLFIVVQVAMDGMDGRRDGGGGLWAVVWYCTRSSCGWVHSCGLERCCMYSSTSTVGRQAGNELTLLVCHDMSPSFAVGISGTRYSTVFLVKPVAVGYFLSVT